MASATKPTDQSAAESVSAGRNGGTFEIPDGPREQELTLQQVAERAGIDLSTLSRLEAGKRRLALDHIPALAAVLSLSTDELLVSLMPPRRARCSTPARQSG